MNEEKIDQFLRYLEMRIDQAERETQRFEAAGSVSNADRWSGSKLAFEDARIAAKQILRGEE